MWRSIQMYMHWCNFYPNSEALVQILIAIVCPQFMLEYLRYWFAWRYSCIISHSLFCLVLAVDLLHVYRLHSIWRVFCIHLEEFCSCCWLVFLFCPLLNFIFPLTLSNTMMSQSILYSVVIAWSWGWPATDALQCLGGNCQQTSAIWISTPEVIQF